MANYPPKRNQALCRVENNFHFFHIFVHHWLWLHFHCPGCFSCISTNQTQSLLFLGIIPFRIPLDLSVFNYSEEDAFVSPLYVLTCVLKCPICFKNIWPNPFWKFWQSTNLTSHLKYLTKNQQCTEKNLEYFVDKNIFGKILKSVNLSMG